MRKFWAQHTKKVNVVENNFVYDPKSTRINGKWYKYPIVILLIIIFFSLINALLVVHKGRYLKNNMTIKLQSRRNFHNFFAIFSLETVINECITPGQQVRGRWSGVSHMSVHQRACLYLLVSNKNELLYKRFRHLKKHFVVTSGTWPKNTPRTLWKIFSGTLKLSNSDFWPICRKIWTLKVSNNQDSS